MSRSDPLATVLFWLMFGVGGAGLALCVLVPAYLDYHAARAQLDAALLRNAEQADQIKSIDRQIEHLATDDAYLERLARQEMGIEIAPGRLVRLEVPENMLPPDSQPASHDPLAPVHAVMRTAVTRYPVLGLFVMDHVRPAMMALSGALVLSALVLLCWPAEPRRPKSAAAGDEIQTA